MQKNIPPFILTQKQKRLFMTATLMIYLNQSILGFIKHTKISWKKFELDY